MNINISLAELLQAGVHFGHKSSRWNPKNKANIFATRGGVHIIDLEKTKIALEKAAEAAKHVAATGGTVLFVGTRKHARDIIKKHAVACGMPYVNVRWLGGTFTNFKTIQKTMKKLESMQGMKASGELESKYTKKERLLIEREMVKMEKLFEGIVNLKRVPELVYVADVKHNHIAVKEAQKAKVKVIGIIDTNSSTEGVEYAIPGNDDAESSIDLLAAIIAHSVKEGKANPIQTPRTAGESPRTAQVGSRDGRSFASRPPMGQRRDGVKPGDGARRPRPASAPSAPKKA